MKYLRFLIILLLIPFMVLAEECDISNITITSMKPNKIEGNTEVISDPTFEDRTINLNLKMYDVNDSITYDLVIKNDSEEDYMIDEDTFKTDSDYIEYTLKTKDNSNVVKANSSKNMTLIVAYKKEVEADKLTNNKFNASNSLKLSLNTSSKEEPLSVITTDNIKEVKNPITSVSSMLLIIIALLITTIIAYILITRKSTYTKYLLIVFSMLLIPTVYAICKCDIEVESTIEIEKKQKLFDTIANIAKEDNSCVSKYEGEVTDEVGKTVTATNVYFDKCAEQRNVIFGGFCWQVVRTTETGGTKLIYNGEPVDGKCESSRGNHKGIVQQNRYDDTLQTINSNYLYGDSFTYDISTGEFTLINTTTATWSDLTYEDLIGKFTCKSSSDTCTAIYQINGYDSNTSAYLSYYTIDNTNYAQIGTSSFNANSTSPAMVGYMFNKSYKSKRKSVINTEYKFGNSFTYNSSTNTYTLSGATKNISNWYDGYNEISGTRYTCWNTSGTCNTLSYVFYTWQYSLHYIDIIGVKTVNDALIEMLSSDDVNKYNSSIKGIVDAWYSQNLLTKTDKLENTVYCNDRSIKFYGGWNPNDEEVTYYHYLQFQNYNKKIHLTCSRVLDQFSVSNNKAKLTYPIALFSHEEFHNLGVDPNTFQENPLINTGSSYWSLSPEEFISDYGYTGYISYGLVISGPPVSDNIGTRPAISLINNTLISSGTGTETDPWIIE